MFIFSCADSSVLIASQILSKLGICNRNLSPTKGNICLCDDLPDQCRAVSIREIAAMDGLIQTHCEIIDYLLRYCGFKGKLVILTSENVPLPNWRGHRLMPEEVYLPDYPFSAARMVLRGLIKPRQDLSETKQIDSFATRVAKTSDHITFTDARRFLWKIIE